MSDLNFLLITKFFVLSFTALGLWNADDRKINPQKYVKTLYQIEYRRRIAQQSANFRINP